MTAFSKTLAAGLVLATAFAPAAFAHHSGAMFDPTKQETVVGVIKEFNWVNPHVTVVVVTDTGPLPIGTWTLEGSSPGVMTRSGWDKRALNPGDKVTVTFSPLRSGALGGSVRKVVLASGKTLSFSTSYIPPEPEQKP